MRIFIKVKKAIILAIVVLCFSVFPLTAVMAEEVIPQETAPVETAPVETLPPETAPPETYPEETYPEETYPEDTTPQETYQEETYYEETDPVETEPETQPEENPETQPENNENDQPENQENTEEAGGWIGETPTYDVNQLPTLVDSTQIAEDLPTAIGADSESGGVSYVGGIVCWIAVGVSAAVIIAFLLSTKGKNKSGIGRYESGNKFGGNRYSDNIKYR